MFELTLLEKFPYPYPYFFSLTTYNKISHTKNFNSRSITTVSQNQLLTPEYNILNTTRLDNQRV